VKAELKKRGIEKEVFSVGGSCCVHDQYMPFHVNNLRNKYPGIKVVAHPECHKDVCALCDYVGSTSGMMNYVKNSEDTQFALLTEEGLVNRLEHDNPGKEFVWQFGRCSFMKRNSLQNILECLEKPNPMQTINLDPATAAKAAKSLEEMFRLTEGR
jgi:quinolinate synthase